MAIACLLLNVAPSFGQTTDAQPTIEAQRDPTAQPPASAAQTAPNPVILRVNGDPVYAVEVSMLMQSLQAQLEQRGEKVDQAELARVATQRVIEQKLLVQEARRFGVKADEIVVARAAQATEEQSGGRAILEAKLKAAGSNYDQFLEMLREIELMRAFVDTQIMGNVTVSEEEIATFYRENPEAFEAEERAHAYHMIFIAGEDAEETALTAARARAESARQLAVAGDRDFISVAKEFSEGPSAPSGGDLGWVTRGQLVSPLSETIFSLQPGEISAVIQSRFGFHVATIDERRPAETISLEEATDQIAQLLSQQKTADTVGQLIETLAKKATVENMLGEGFGDSVVGLD